MNQVICIYSGTFHTDTLSLLSERLRRGHGQQIVNKNKNIPLINCKNCEAVFIFLLNVKGKKCDKSCEENEVFIVWVSAL